MRIVALCSFREGREVMEEQYPFALREIHDAIKSVDTERRIAKRTTDNHPGHSTLRSRKELRTAFIEAFETNGWQRVRVEHDYPIEYYVNGYRPPIGIRGSYTEMDFVKDQVGIEVQLIRCVSMVCSVAAKMTIFHRLGHINVGVEIVPVKELASKLSPNASFFEQHVWDLQCRGISNIDIPIVSLLGVVRKSSKLPSPKTIRR